MTSENTRTSDVIIIGAGAAGLMCAIEAGKRGRKVVVLDHSNKAGKKILMSGGGRCNFTNMDVSAENYISHNPHFCKSALSRYTQWDFIEMVRIHHIAYQERDLGKLFCENSAKDILNMLLYECRQYNVEIVLNCEINEVSSMSPESFVIESSQGDFHSSSLVIASGGLSIPKMCGSPIGYRIAQQFGHHIWPTFAGLVPFTLHKHDKEKLDELSGISVASRVSNQRKSFDENILFTHRGLSGPAILQISSYWKPGEAIEIDLLPGIDLSQQLYERQQSNPNMKLRSVLGELLPKRVPLKLLGEALCDKSLQELSKAKINEIANELKNWSLVPNGTEGYRTAEVTVGGIDCDEISSKTMESKKRKGLYFIGEVVDVTGWLGGYNFQWAWSSGWCAGQVV